MIKITLNKKIWRFAAVACLAALAVATLIARQWDWQGVCLVLLAIVGAAGALLGNVAAAPRGMRLAMKIGAGLLCVALAFFITQCWGMQPLPFSWMAERPLRMLLALPVIIALFTLFFAFTGSLFAGISIGTALLAVFSIACYVTFTLRGTYLIPSDLLGAGTAARVLGAYRFSPDATLLLILYLTLCVVAIASKTRLPFSPGLRGKLISRGTALVCSLALLFTFTTTPFVDLADLGPYYWNQSATAQSNGNLLNFIGNMPDLYTPAPDGYSPESAAELAAGWPSDTPECDVRPDVILVLGESWGRLTPDATSSTDIAVTPFMDSFGERENTIAANLAVSTFASSTSVPEFEILTGSTMAYGLNIAPYTTYVTAPMPSLASSLRQLGYDSTAIHTGYPASWGRSHAYPLLGFDRYICMEDFETNITRLRGYATDETLYREALARLDEGGDKPQFLFCLTIATHGGYDIPSYKSPVHITSPEGEFPKTEQYLGLMNRADKAFEHFVAALQKRERPTVLLAFGDHLPGVENEYLNQVLPDDPLARYTTPLYMWANYDLPEGVLQNGETVSTNYAGALLMEAAGLPLTGYQKFLLDARADLPAISRIGCMDNTGQFTLLRKVMDTGLLNEEAILQYNLIFDKKDYPANFFAFPQE